MPRNTNAQRLPRLGGGALAALYIAVALLPLGFALARDAAHLAFAPRAGAGLGIVALTAMAVQFVTSGRFAPVSGRLGIDKIMAFHKIAAWWVLLAVVLHPLLYVLPTWLAHPANGMQRLGIYLTVPHYRSGVIAAGALALVVVTAALRERLPLPYEVWRASHVMLGLVAAGAGLHHALAVGRFSAPGLLGAWWWGVAAALAAVIGTLYGWRWFRLHRRAWRLAAVTKRADRTWELDIQPAAGTPDLSYDAGQFVWMTAGARRFPLFDHPFSIADSPARPGISVIVKEAGDFTDGVGRLAPGTAIGIDGPYGEFSLEHHPGRAILLVAGGVGIGPIMGLLRDLVARRDPRPVRIAYAAARPANFACLSEIRAAEAALALRTLLVSETPGAGFEGEVGRIDAARLAALLDGVDRAETVAFICGPGPMMASVADTLEDLGLAPDRIVYERFDYAGGHASRQVRRRRVRFLAVGAALALGVVAFAAVRP